MYDISIPYWLLADSTLIKIKVLYWHLWQTFNIHESFPLHKRFLIGEHSGIIKMFFNQNAMVMVYYFKILFCFLQFLFPCSV